MWYFLDKYSVTTKAATTINNDEIKPNAKLKTFVILGT